MTDVEEAIEEIKDEIRSYERAPEINGEPLNESQRKWLRIYRTALKALEGVKNDGERI